MTTSSAAVFTQYYANTTATVKTPDLTLTAGSDDVDSPTIFPAIDAEVTGVGTATIAMSLFKDAKTYYTDALTLTNDGTENHDITGASITVTDVSKLGEVTVYLYSTQTDTPSTTDCIAYATLTSASTGTVSFTLVAASYPTLATDDVLTIEIVGNAGASASAADTVTFKINLNWA
jgi:hypothetical protein